MRSHYHQGQPRSSLRLVTVLGRLVEFMGWIRGIGRICCALVIFVYVVL